MLELVKMIHGSHCYGTATEHSDTDYKGVFLPSDRSILLQQNKKGLRNNTKKTNDVKNGAGDIDDEFYSFQHFVKLLLEGQSPCLEMLFMPESFYVSGPAYPWLLLKKNVNKFLHSGTSALVGYTMHQAAKYGVKGSRVNSVRGVLEWLKPFDPHMRLLEIGNDSIRRHLAELEHADVVYIKGAQGKDEPHLEVCNRKVPFHATVKYATTIFQRIFDEYGQRALLAEKNEGIDWKALSHAVRVASQTKELLSTGFITLPRPDAPLLLQVKKGELPYKQVAEIIEQGLADVTSLQEKSVLPKEPDHAFAEELVCEVHRKVINGTKNSS